MTQNLIGLLFLSREFSHRAHLATTSFAVHSALNGFYHEIVELADQLAEVAQGTGPRLVIPYLPAPDSDDVALVLGEHLRMFRETSDVLYARDRAMSALADEIVALYRATLYKLTLA